MPLRLSERTSNSKALSTIWRFVLSGRHVGLAASSVFQALQTLMHLVATMQPPPMQSHDLASPPGNHLEALKGDREGQHSIRVNDQWRICFVWREGDAYNVEIVDYH